MLDMDVDIWSGAAPDADADAHVLHLFHVYILFLSDGSIMTTQAIKAGDVVLQIPAPVTIQSHFHTLTCSSDEHYKQNTHTHTQRKQTPTNTSEWQLLKQNAPTRSLTYHFIFEMATRSTQQPDMAWRFELVTWRVIAFQTCVLKLYDDLLCQPLWSDCLFSFDSWEFWIIWSLSWSCSRVGWRNHVHAVYHASG